MNEHEVYFSFVGIIDQQSCGRIIHNLSVATQDKKLKSIHLMFQSTGGAVGDAICLYNYLQCMPLDVVIYNTGTLSSAAVLVYLGAKIRVVQAGANFMVHRTHASPQFATASKLQMLTKSLTADDARSEDILRRHIRLTRKMLTIHRNHDLWFTTDEAITYGIADKIGSFQPPVGQNVYSLIQ